jgi:hypothetical protein
METRPLLEELERHPDPAPALAFLAAQGLALDVHELRAARRRAMLLLAAGGDPRRELEPDGPAVSSVASDLDAPEHRHVLAGELRRLREGAEGLASVSATLDRLQADPDLAWRWLACALLAEELVGEETA